MGYGKTVEGALAAKAARERGEKRYFTGLPCKAGHIAERHVSNNTCFECRKYQRQANPGAQQKRMQRPEVRARKLASARRCSKRPHIRAAANAANAARRAAKLQRTPKWADLKEIRKFYDEMHRLTRETGVQHHVDHILPMQGELVSGLHVAENLRVIKATPNLSKGSKFEP